VEPTAEEEGVIDPGEGERWNAALLNLARAVGAEVTPRIEDVTPSDCTVVLEKSDAQLFRKILVPIETLEDPSSRQFEIVIAEAKAGLGVMTEYRGFTYKLSNRSDLDLTCDAEIWATGDARGVGASPISRHTGVTPRDAERAARYWIDRQSR
jgi:hypothetical protein